jgi:sialate O-acetylesterase
MEFTMAPGGARPGVVDFQKEIGEARYPAIRMIDVRHTVADTPVMGVSGQWKVCSPATAGQFSAVAYYFARKIYEERGVPVGIINSSFGGTPIEAWMKRAVLERDTGFRRLLDRYAEEGVRYPDRHREYLIKMDRWHRDTSANRGRAPAAPPGPKSSFSPGKLYNGMIAPLLNVNIAGVIWYQGEASGRDAELYRRLFPALIRSWRGDFKKGRLPFYFVEIGNETASGNKAASGAGATVSGNRAASGVEATSGNVVAAGGGATSGGGPSSGAGALLVRDAQRKTFREVPHTGIVVAVDTGSRDELRNKKPIGEALARLALGK